MLKKIKVSNEFSERRHVDAFLLPLLIYLL